MDIMGYIAEKMIVVIPVLWIVGIAVKKTERIPNNWIPLILLALGAALGVAMLGSVDGLIQGVLCGGASVGLHQAQSQLRKGDNENE